MTDFLIHETNLDAVIEGAASEVAAQYARWGIEADGVAQCARSWVNDHLERLDQLSNDYPKHWARILDRLLQIECRFYCEQLKAQALGYAQSDVFYYSCAGVEHLLPALFDENAWQDPSEWIGPKGTSGGRRPGPGGEWVATLADLGRAFGRLGRQDRLILRGYYAEECKNREIAEALGITESTMSYRRKRALDRMVKLLGGERPRRQHDDSCNHPPRGAFAARV